MTHMYFSARAEGRISYGHLGRTNSCCISSGGGGSSSCCISNSSGSGSGSGSANVWLGVIVVRGRTCEHQSWHCRASTLDKSFTPMCHIASEVTTVWCCKRLINLI